MANYVNVKSCVWLSHLVSHHFNCIWNILLKTSKWEECFYISTQNILCRSSKPPVVVVFLSYCIFCAIKNTHWSQDPYHFLYVHAIIITQSWNISNSQCEKNCSSNIRPLYSASTQIYFSCINKLKWPICQYPSLWILPRTKGEWCQIQV